MEVHGTSFYVRKDEQSIIYNNEGKILFKGGRRKFEWESGKYFITDDFYNIGETVYDCDLNKLFTKGEGDSLDGINNTVSCLVNRRDHKYFLMDENGKEMTKKGYAFMYKGIGEKYIQVENNGKKGLIDTKGKEILECKYDLLDIEEVNSKTYILAYDKENKIGTVVGPNGIISKDIFVEDDDMYSFLLEREESDNSSLYFVWADGDYTLKIKEPLRAIESVGKGLIKVYDEKQKSTVFMKFFRENRLLILNMLI